MDADCARLLREPDHGILDIGGRDHHQVSELVNNAEQVRQRLIALIDAVLV